jgi:hypothetical protein
MRPRIKSGQLITLEPCSEEPQVGAAVLCKVKGNQYVHLVKAVKGHDSKRRFLIGNNHGGINGWITRQAIYGVVTKVGE